MKIEIELSEDEIKEAVLKICAERYKAEFSTDRRHVNTVVDKCVREIIYKDKERIVDRIVDRASRECRNKAVKKIVESTLSE